MSISIVQGHSCIAKLLRIIYSKLQIINSLPYLSILNPGSYTCRGSNICRVVQQNEGNKRLDPFKCQMSKLFNLIIIEMVPYVEENKLIINTSLDMCILISDIATINYL